MSLFSTSLPTLTLIRATIARDPISQSKIGIHIKQGDNGGIVIYYVEPQSLAADSGLSRGCEILAVNDHPVYSVRKCLGELLSCTKYGGKANILASRGHRPRGYAYVLVKNFNSNSKRIFSGSGNIIDGLMLEEKKTRVKILRIPSFTSSFFHGLNLNRGDLICTINGVPINSIEWMKLALKVASEPLVAILTYNSFRRLKLAVNAYHQDEIKRIGSDNLTKIEDEYDIHEQSGVDQCSVVNRATHKASGETYSIKRIKRGSLNINVDAAIKDEINILKTLNHDGILSLHNEFITISHYYLVTGYVDGGVLFDHIARKALFTEAEARNVCEQLFDALDYIHSKGIVHRDLKPEHIFLKYKNGDSVIKLTGFGFAKAVDSEDHSLITLCGTPGYVAPEVLRRVRYGSKADVWSLGVTIFFMILGYRPFVASTEQGVNRLIKMGKFSFDDKSGVSVRVKDMMESLLVTDPRQRASAKELLSHPWMLEDKNKLAKFFLANAQAQFKHVAQKIIAANTISSNATFSGRMKMGSIKE